MDHPDATVRKLLDAVALMEKRLTAALAGCHGEQTARGCTAFFDDGRIDELDVWDEDATSVDADDSVSASTVDRELRFDEFTFNDKSAQYHLSSTREALFSDGANPFFDEAYYALTVFDQMPSPCFDGEPIFDEVSNDSITEYELPFMEAPHFALRCEKIQLHVDVAALRGEEHLVSLETMKSKVEAGNTMAAMAAAASPLPSLLAAGNLTPSSIAQPHLQAGAVGSSESELAAPSSVHDDSVALIAVSGRCDYARANEMTSAQIDAMAQDETDEIANTVEQLTGLGVERVVATALPPIGCTPWLSRSNNYGSCSTLDTLFQVVAVYKFRDPKTSDQEMLESICGVLMPLKLQAKVSRPMDIIINSLYNNKDIFVWEPISNVSDALERIRILSLTDKEVLVEGDTEKLEIQIQLDKEKKMLSMQDKGIGMTIIANGVQVRPLPWPSFYYYAAWMRWMKSLVMALCWDLFGAGTETTSVTTEWAPSLLLNHPEALKKAQAELDAVVGSSHLITTNDMCCLGYLHCIINETLHMYSAAMLLLPHESMVDCKVDGYDGTLSKDDGLVDGLRKCEQWKWQDIIASKETKTSSWFHEFIGRAKKPEMRCPPFGCGCGWDVVPYKQPCHHPCNLCYSVMVFKLDLCQD
jgi:hypothetical protein